MTTKSKINTPKLVLYEFLIIVVFGLSTLLTAKYLFAVNSPFNSNVALSLIIPLFVVVGFGFGFVFFVEYKNKNINLKNIFIYLAIALALFNMLAVIIIPSNFSLPSGEILNLNFKRKLFDIIIGFSEAFLIVLYFVIAPKILNKKTIKIIYISLIVFSLLCVLLSFCLESKTYIEIIKSGFSSDKSVKSILAHKNAFGLALFIGISSSVLISTFSHNYKWLITVIPMIIALPFTGCKIANLLSFILIIGFAIYKIVEFAKLSKNNLFITFMCLTFVIAIGIVLVIFTVNCNYGILFKIKTTINNIFTQGSETFNSRIAIWKTSFSLLSPIQYIIGCGTTIFCEALNISHHATEEGIYNAHNAYIELIGEGGIIKLLIDVILIILLIYYLLKIWNKNKIFSFINLMFVVLYLIYGIFEPINLICFDSSHLFNLLLVLPIMCIYYFNYDKQTIESKNKLIKLSKQIKLDENDNCFTKLNKKYIKFKNSAQED